MGWKKKQDGRIAQRPGWSTGLTWMKFSFRGAFTLRRLRRRERAPARHKYILTDDTDTKTSMTKQIAKVGERPYGNRYFCSNSPVTDIQGQRP
ncbi:hypothetical protein VUR80DRAFT_2509 [Thermomyces stellatus]